MGMHHAQAVWLGDKLCVGGGMTSSESNRDDARLYIYTPTTDTWSAMDTPVCYFALIIYHSQLVLVGGRKYVDEESYGPVTNKLWTLGQHDQWRETLSPMTTKRCSASALEYVDNILVAGGHGDTQYVIDIVEVYNGHHWAKPQRLPTPCYDVKSTVLNGHWYLMGGVGQRKEVYYASLDSLVAISQSSEKLPSVWKRLADVPHERSSPAMFGNRLIAVGGGVRLYSLSSSIHAYSPHTQSWLHVGDMPVKLHSTCTAVLTTGELMVIGGWSSGYEKDSCVYQASLNGNESVPVRSINHNMTCMYVSVCIHVQHFPNAVTFSPDNLFTMEALIRLEKIGITTLRELEAYKKTLQSVIGIEIVELSMELSSFSLLNMWLQGRASLRPTWRHFLWVLREIKLNHLVEQVEGYLSGVAVELAATSNVDPSPVSEEEDKEKEGGADKKL